MKQYTPSHKVGRPSIQKLHSAKIDTGAAKAVFVTTSSFTDPAKAYAERNGIRLIDGNGLVRLINKATSSKEN